MPVVQADISLNDSQRSASTLLFPRAHRSAVFNASIVKYISIREYLDSWIFVHLSAPLIKNLSAQICMYLLEYLNTQALKLSSGQVPVRIGVL